MKDKILIILSIALLVAVGVEGYYLYQMNKQLSNQNSYYKPIANIQQPKPVQMKQLPPQATNQIQKGSSSSAPSSNFFINAQPPLSMAINPFKEFQKMQEEMNRVFGSFNARFQNDPDFDRFFQDFSISPALDMRDAGDKYIITVNIPGSQKNNIKVTVKNHILNISAKTEKISDKKSSKFLQKERFVGTFEREVTLPSDADENTLKTKYNNGILTITIAKRS